MHNVLHLLIVVSLLGNFVLTSPEHVYRDGPVGLPNHIPLRASKKERRRKHSKRIVESHEYTKQLDTIASNSKPNVSEMSKAIEQDRTNGIIANTTIYNAIVNLNYLPEWLKLIPASMQSPKEFIVDALTSLTKMGLSPVLQSQVFKNVSCSLFSSEAEKAVCMAQSIDNVNNVLATGTLVLTLNFRILAGGRMANDALVTLDTLAADPQNTHIIKSLGSTFVLYITLMRETVPDETKAMAGSIMTKLTGLPVVSNIADTSSGGFGRVNVVLPRPTRVHRADYDIAKLKAGAHENDVL